MLFRSRSASGTVRIGVVAQESNSQSIVERTKGFVEEMTKLVGEDKVSVEGHDSLKKEKAGAPVVIDVGIPAEVKDANGAAVASAILEKSDLIAIYGSNEFAANAIITANEGSPIKERVFQDRFIGFYIIFSQLFF